MKKFFVVRAVNRRDGTVSAPVESYDEYKPALSTFYIRAGQAANSGETNITDTVALLNVKGELLQSIGFNHDEEQYIDNE